MVSLEESSGVVGTIDSYVPHVVGGVKYTHVWGAITGVAAYDSNRESLAAKFRVDINLPTLAASFGTFGPDLVGDRAPLGTGGFGGLSCAKAVAMSRDDAAAALTGVHQHVPHESDAAALPCD
ncbi:hypothetical protein X758_29880 [Mesorhizobium sp. LSHC416B00]|nr:hypothetical protein X761_28310 [Mesorhizobium sp. LSHC424B00]ESX65366.1 hypothetical protein X758_29880 [Mesorhizobium sp. LSHC416B00]